MSEENDVIEAPSGETEPVICCSYHIIQDNWKKKEISVKTSHEGTSLRQLQMQWDGALYRSKLIGKVVQI